jgi:transposase
MVSYVHNCRRHIDDAAVICARKWRREGVTYSKIALLLHVSRSTVKRHMSGPLPSQKSRRTKPKPSKAVVARRKIISRLMALRIRRTLPTPSRRPGQRGRLRVPREVVVAPFRSPSSIARRLTELGVPTHMSTVRRDLLAMAFTAKKRPRGPRFFAGDREGRVAFAVAFLRRPLGQRVAVLFSDEKYCDSNDNGCTWQWVRRGEAPDPRRYEAWAPKVHVWGMIGKGVKVLVFLPSDQRVNSDVYVEKCIKPNLKTMKNRLFMHDGAPAHRSEATGAKLKQMGVNLLPNWPPRSPDLNPIETLWAILSSKVSERGPLDEDELTLFIRQEWKKISQKTIDGLVLLFEKRLLDVIASKGEIVK